MAELIFKDEVYAIIGAAMEVYNALGPGFVEAVYQEAFGIELLWRKIPVKPQKELVIQYKNFSLKKTFTADYIAFDKIVVEIKALDQLSSRDEAQLLNYLKATSMSLGLLINFGAHSDLEWKRMAATQYQAKFNRSSYRIRED
jgi:GxxExxY protein